MAKKLSVLQRLFAKLRRLFYQECTVVLAAKPLKEITPYAYDDVRSRPFTEADVPVFASGFSNLPKLYREWKDKYTGVVLEKDGRPAACLWYTGGSKDNEGVPPFTFSVVLPKGVAYVFANYVLPEFRGSNVFFLQPAVVEPDLYRKNYRLTVIALFDPRLVAYYRRRKYFVVGELRFKRYLSLFVKKELSDLELLCTL